MPWNAGYGGSPQLGKTHGRKRRKSRSSNTSWSILDARDAEDSGDAGATTVVC